MPSYPSVIGLTGRARSGKDTVADFLIAARPGLRRYAFADPIRKMLIPLGVDLRDDYWVERKEETIPLINASPRRLMQTLGTEWGRNLIHPDLWLRFAEQDLLNNGPGVVITDVRFENEAEFVRKYGVLIHIKRERVDAVATHVSESGIAIHEGDFTLWNNGTLDSLQAAVESLSNVLYQT